MTTLQKSSRANSVRQRRSSQKRSKLAVNTQRTGTRRTTQTARQAYRPDSIFLPVEPRPVAPTTLRKMKGSTVSLPIPVSGSKGSGMGRMTKNSRRKGYDLAINLGRTAVRTPVLNLPALGTRWVSAGLTLFLCLLLFTMGSANTFKVAGAEVSGNQRLGTDEVNAMLGMVGQPSYKAVPSQIEKNLRTAFPDLAGVSVRVGFPNHISVAVVERTPILAWYHDGNTTWVDNNGIAFMPRGDIQDLIQIASDVVPAKPTADPQGFINDQPFISPATVQAIVTLYPQIPGGVPMIYDQKYGMGWQDPRGWSVYFGQNTQAIEMKKNVYQVILDTFSQQGIQPTLISVANLDAPFYK
jgi:hypothetical protein